MKVTRLEIKNLGIIADADIEINKALLLFYGDIRVGKTTILNAVKWCFGGAYPEDIIRHGETEARVKLSFDHGSVERTWYRGAKGIMAREVTLVIDGEVKKKPVAFLKQFLNPLLLDQDHFKNKNVVDRNRFMCELFDVDTSDVDATLVTAEQAARDLRATLKAFGTVDVAPVTLPDVASAIQALNDAKTGHAQSLEVIRASINELDQNERLRRTSWDEKIAERRKIYEAQLRAARDINTRSVERQTKRKELIETIDDTEAKLVRLRAEVIELDQGQAACKMQLAASVAIESVSEPEAPGYSDLTKQRDNTTLVDAERNTLLRQLSAPANVGVQEALLEEARQQEIKYDAYKASLVRVEERKRYSNALALQEKKINDLRASKIAKLKELSTSTGIPGLMFDEAGSFTYDDTAAGMLSTSQIMELSSKLEALYPEGLGISLIDRGESLGTSIFEYVDEAKKGSKSILAAIVGDKPAIESDDIGVFVVEDGRVAETT